MLHHSRRAVDRVPALPSSDIDVVYEDLEIHDVEIASPKPASLLVITQEEAGFRDGLEGSFDVVALGREVPDKGAKSNGM